MFFQKFWLKLTTFENRITRKMEGILPSLTHLDPLVTICTPHPELLCLTMLLVLRGPSPGDPKWELNPGWRQDFVLQPGGFPAVCLAAQTWIQCFTSHHLGEVQFVIARPTTQVFCPNILVIKYVLPLLDWVVCRAVGEVLVDAGLAVVAIIVRALPTPNVTSHLDINWKTMI